MFTLSDKINSLWVYDEVLLCLTTSPAFAGFDGFFKGKFFPIYCYKNMNLGITIHLHFFFFTFECKCIFICLVICILNLIIQPVIVYGYWLNKCFNSLKIFYIWVIFSQNSKWSNIYVIKHSQNTTTFPSKSDVS
jgi:hypothetical protein